jgi:hypothetical protein
MSLLSAFDDFVSRTLALIPGLLARIEYVASLREEGRYAHWGLARVHGSHAAERALNDAHNVLIAEALQTPLRALAKDNEASCAAEGRESKEYLEGLRSRHINLLPDESSRRATRRHFSSVLCALSALARAQRRATRPDA